MLEKAPELPVEKLPQPHLPAEVRPEESAKLDKVSGLIPAESTPPGQPPKGLLVKPQEQAPSPNPKKVTGPIILRKDPAPSISSSPAPLMEPVKVIQPQPELKKVSEAKPLLMPVKVVKSPEIAPVPSPSAVLVTAKAPAGKLLPAKTAEKPPVTASPAKSSATASMSLPAKAPLPLTRAERAGKRRRVETIGFYVIFVLVLLGLYFGGIFFSRETRVEGQVIPPSGMTLNNEAWIVNDFRDLSSGIAEDLAAERARKLQDIQEPQDHVQRAQADVAAREERIRLLMEEIQTTKDEVGTIVKQSHDATQQVWDVEGAQLDQEYEARLNQFQQTIADRAKSLKLKYQPDDSFHSPEVWANAYRLALYEVPAGVDSVKEHQWLADQMKQWRDYLKTLDDRKEQLREKAAQLKLERIAENRRPQWEDRRFAASHR